MTVANGDILKVTMEVTLDDGTIAQNVFRLEAQLAAPQADLTVVNAIEVWIEDCYNELSSELVDEITQNLCSVDEESWNAVLGAWEVTRNVGLFTPTVTYGNLSDPLPNACAATATFDTDRPRSNGRKGMFPFGEDQQGSGFLEPSTLTAMAGFAAEVLAGILLSPFNNLVPGIIRVGVDAFLPFISASVTNVLGSQRTRKPGIGA